MRGLGSVARLLARQAARGSGRSAKELCAIVTRSEAVAVLTSRRGLTTLGGCSRGPFAYNSNRAALAMAECVAFRALDRVRFMAADAGLPSAVLVPTMGESIKDGSIATVLKAAGDSVEEDEVIAQIETDKVTIDVRSPRAGVVQKIEVKVGDTVTPGTTVAFVASSSTAPAATPAGAGVHAPSAAATVVGPIADEEGGGDGEGVDEYSLIHGDDTVEVVVPSMGESVNDGVLAALLKSVGDSVRVDEVIGQVETDKVTIDVRSPDEGVVERVNVQLGDTVTPGTPIAVVRRAKALPASTTLADRVVEAVEGPRPLPVARAAPPSPPPAASRPSAAAPGAAAPAVPIIPKQKERRVPMTRLRRRVAQRLKDSQNTFAMLTTFNEIDMTNLIALRNDFKDAFYEKHGIKLGFMSAFVKAASSALQQEPAVNAVIDGDDIVYRDYIDVSIAVGTPKGLVVPVIRKVHELSFVDVERVVADLGRKARDGSISIDDMAGGTFTISNGGVYGSLISTPIINPPQSAILGMHAIQQRPVVVGKEIVARPMMYVALTYDHRLIDGREAVLFLRRIKDIVEDPRRILLDI
ncbi:hypothetical protein CLOM_g17883 [Closterium sp. NIES-68]|nr:hypothetical protein CLOM_g17883 [Closterium sp. NIES-68]GJP74005.1 hypothetical protein CLOP_g4658 [Closterium sp. NIES-67]